MTIMIAYMHVNYKALSCSLAQELVVYGPII